MFATPKVDSVLATSDVMRGPSNFLDSALRREARSFLDNNGYLPAPAQYCFVRSEWFERTHALDQVAL